MQENKAWDEHRRLESWELADLRELRDHLEELIRRKESAGPRHNVREFRGIGHGTWRAVGGVDEFLKQERAGWDERDRYIEQVYASCRKEDSEPLYDVMDFEGIGHGTWREVGGVDEFIRQERHPGGKRDKYIEQI